MLAVLVALCVTSLGRTGDFEGYLEVGALLLGGAHPYAEATPGVNTWPPVFGLVCIPLALVAQASVLLARGLWLVVNLAALLWCVHLVTGLVWRRPLALDPRRRGVPLASVAVLAPLVLAYPGVTGNFFHLQINTIVFAVVLTGLACHARGRHAAGGVLIGVAAALRVMPLVFVPYLVWRGHWRTALAALVTFVLVSLAPALAYGWDAFADWTRSWWDAASTGWGSGYWNQSIEAMWDRTVGLDLGSLLDAPTEITPASGEPVVKILTAATLGLLAVTALLVFRGRSRPAGRRDLAEWSIVFLVGAIGGPVCWKHYLVVLLLPLALLVRVRRAPGEDQVDRRIALALLVSTFLLITLPSRDFVGRWLAVRLETASTFTLGCLILLAGLFVLRRRWQRA